MPVPAVVAAETFAVPQPLAAVLEMPIMKASTFRVAHSAMARTPAWISAFGPAGAAYMVVASWADRDTDLVAGIVVYVVVLVAMSDIDYRRLVAQVASRLRRAK
jgi:hypothetical protein